MAIKALAAVRERDAFLSAIRAEPQDDAVRLVFADGLDEHGEPDRAAFIRAQCNAAALPTWAVERRLLLWQANGLLDLHPEWRLRRDVAVNGVTVGLTCTIARPTSLAWQSFLAPNSVFAADNSGLV
jgi:uncharacterized protein (TIGR02996 family)